jgi:hypothetical protein
VEWEVKMMIDDVVNELLGERMLNLMNASNRETPATRETPANFWFSPSGIVKSHCNHPSMMHLRQYGYDKLRW